MKGRRIPFLLLVFLLAACRKSTTPAVPSGTPNPGGAVDPFAQAKRLGRGINLGDALEAPQEGDWGVVLQEEYFQLIRKAGFDTVRVPIRWSAHALAEPPYTVDEAFAERVDWVIEKGLKQGLNVVIDMHHYDEILVDPDNHTERWIALWKQIAARYRDRPDKLYLEPLNEPYDQLTPAKWNDLLEKVIAAIRQLDGVHTLIIDAPEWAGIGALPELRIPETEQNVICSFHFYEPYLFTHQGAEWMDSLFGTIGVQWPGPPKTALDPLPAARSVDWANEWFRDYNTLPYEKNPAGPQPIIEALDSAVEYGKKLGRPLWLGEFGAYNKADMQSRVNWTTFVRQEAEKRGLSWAYWEFAAGFGVYDKDARQWNEELLRSLVPGG